jgi:ligand-binding sensor domain-containing protein/signal transduction histidine kinase
MTTKSSLRNSNSSLKRERPRWPSKLLLAVLTMVCFATSANALSSNKAISEYIRDRWDAGAGFPGGPVNAFAQTPDGYLWIATEKGLVRFDGLNFVLIEHSESTTVPFGPVLGLALDANGSLWIRLQGPTLMVRDRSGEFRSVTPDSSQAESDITAMCMAKNGELLIAGLTKGIFRDRNGQFATSATSDELPRHVISMIELADGMDWLGTREQGLYSLNGRRASRFVGELPDKKVNALLSLNGRDLWIGTDQGLVRWDGRGLSRVSSSQALQNVEIVTMARDRESNVWIGSSKGLARVSNDGVTSVDSSRGWPAEPVTALFEDREGSLWVGRADGIERLRDTVFTTYYASGGVLSRNNGPLYVDSEGRTWFGPSEGGLFWRKEGHMGRVIAAAVQKDIVYSIDGRKGELWIGRRGGLTRLRESGGSFTAKTYTAADGLAQNRVYAVHRSGDGTVWAGTLSAGLSRLKDGTFTTYTVANGLVSNSISSIAESSDGTMWFGTPNGLNELSEGHLRAYTSKDGLPPGNVNCLLPDSNGVLWIGTDNGLAFLRSGTVHALSDDVPDSVREEIFAMAEDKAGALWMATAKHIVRVDRDKLLRQAVAGSDIREYGLGDGLLSAQGVRRHNSIAVDQSGGIWFSTNRGLSFVSPTSVKFDSAPPLVHVDGISVDGHLIHLGEQVRVRPPHQKITISYSGLSLAFPTRVRFMYRLDGFDQSWTASTSAREATYTNLESGQYRFHVMASNREGVWNSEEAILPFEVEPVLWQTWWFRVSCVVAFLALLWALYQLRLRQVARQFNIRLEERVSERTRIARDLHDTLLQSFNGLLLRFQAATNLLPERPAEARKTLESAIDQAAQAITEGRNAVQGLRSSTIMASDFALTINTLGQELASGDTNPNAAEFHVEVEGTPQNLHPILRDEVYRIAGEALRNAFKHAQAQRIEVETRYDERQLRLRVRDDGQGIDAKHLDGEGYAGHYGLRGMRERATLMGGKLTVWSELDSGTEVELSIPASRAYETSPARRRSWLAEKFSGKDTEMKS